MRCAIAAWSLQRKRGVESNGEASAEAIMSGGECQLLARRNSI